MLGFYIATLTESPVPLYAVGRLQVRTAEESGAFIDVKPPLQPTAVVPVAALKGFNPPAEIDTNLPTPRGMGGLVHRSNCE
jgi:hypothetical protein